MPIRTATLDDVQAICNLFRTQVERWQRINAQGQVEDVEPDDLVIHERWLHGGAWMSIETGAIWLSHLIRVGICCLVLEENHKILGYLEAYPGDEPEPYHKHLHLGQFVVHPLAAPTVSEELITHLLRVAAGYGRVTAACSTYDREKAQFFRSFGLAPLKQIQQYHTSAQAGQGFYKSVEHHLNHPEQIQGWQMPVGRTTSSRQQWETHWSNLWNAIPQITAQKLHRIRFNTSGQDAFVCIQQQLYDPRSADIYCWSPKSLSKQLFIAINDWAYKQGYRTLVLAVDDKIAKALGDDLEAEPHHQQLFARDL